MRIIPVIFAVANDLNLIVTRPLATSVVIASTSISVVMSLSTADGAIVEVIGMNRRLSVKLLVLIVVAAEKSKSGRLVMERRREEIGDQDLETLYVNAMQ